MVVVARYIAVLNPDANPKVLTVGSAVKYETITTPLPPAPALPLHPYGAPPPPPPVFAVPGCA